MHRRAVIVLVLVGLVIVAQLAAIRALVTVNSEVTASGWDWDTPHDGSFVVAGIYDRDANGHRTPAAQAGLQVGDRVVAIYSARGEGGLLRSLGDVSSMDHAIHRGEPWVIVIERTDPARGVQQLRVSMPPADAGVLPGNYSRLELALKLMLPLVALITACLIGLAKPADDHAFVAALVFVCFASIGLDPLGLDLPTGFRELSTALSAAGSLFLFYLLMRFFLMFPSRSVIDRKLPWLANLLVLPMTIVWVPWTVQLFLSQRSFEAARLLQRVRDLTGLLGQAVNWTMCLVGLAALTLSVLGAESRDSRRRLGILLSGTALAFIPNLLIRILAAVFHFSVADLPWIEPVEYIALLLFPVTFAYVVLRHRVFGIRVMIRRGLQYVLVSRAFLAAEGLVLFLICLFGAAPLAATFAADTSSAAVTGLTAVVALGLVAGVQRVNARVMPAIDRRFFREAYDTHRILTALAQSVRTLVGRPKELLQTTVEQIGRSLHPHSVTVFVRHSSGTYRCAVSQVASHLQPTVADLDEEVEAGSVLAQ